MGNRKTTCAGRALCQALEPRLLLAADPLDPAGQRLGHDLSALSAEFISFKTSKKPGPFRPSNPLLHIADNRIAIEAAADDPAALKKALKPLKVRRASIAGHMVSVWVPLGRLDDLAKIPGLRFARPALFTTRA